MGGRQEGQEDIKCSLGGCHAWLMPCPLAGDSEGKLGGCSPHNHCPRSIDRRPRRPPRYAHCHKRPWRNLVKKFPKMRRGRSSSRRVCLAVCVVGGVLIYASVAYTILRPATAPGGQPAMEGVARNRSNDASPVAERIDVISAAVGKSLDDVYGEGDRRLSKANLLLIDADKTIRLPNGVTLLLLKGKGKIEWLEGESMCSLRGEQVCVEGDDLCQVIKTVVGSMTVTLSHENVTLSQLNGQRVNSTRMLGRDEDIRDFNQLMDQRDEHWMPINRKHQKQTDTWMDMQCGLTRWPSEHKHSALVACCKPPAPPAEPTAVQETPKTKRLSQHEVAYKSSDFMLQKEEESARIISTAYLDVELIIARSTLSREELKQFSSERLAKGKAPSIVLSKFDTGLSKYRSLLLVF
jgi:hypothetical protein